MVRVINLDSVSCVRDGNVILDNLNFDIEKGSFVSIVGSNGSGKSTLVKVLAGIFQYNGYINIDGYSLNKVNMGEIRKKVSVVLSDMDNMFIGETVCDELATCLNNLGKDELYIGKRVMEVAKLFEIEDILNKGVMDITNSEREKVFIAEALMNFPDIVIIDDCMHQLCVYDKKLVFKILNKYKKDKKLTIIMVSHDMEDVINSDRIIVMNKGKIAMDGSVVSVFKQKEKLFKFGIKIPFVMDLSLRLMDEGIVNHVYLDMRKLVDDIWK